MSRVCPRTRLPSCAARCDSVAPWAARRHPISSWFESHEANLAGSVYGAILVTSVIAAASAEKDCRSG